MGSRSEEATDAARKRMAVEIIARHERALRQTARRYSLCAADAEDAYQRALEILLTKAPAGDARELIRWMQTVTKHEALAVRRHRERLLSGVPTSAGGGEEEEDWVALVPAQSDGPQERVERREAVARSREALQALKPAELQALTLLAEGYSYTEISRLTGFTRTKVNRCLAEGRERYRKLLSRSEDGSRCEELRPLLSAFCDGEAGAQEVATVREHLRACAPCRAAMRDYKAAPEAAAALAPGLPLGHSLLDRLRDAFGDLWSRLPGTSTGAEGGAQVAVSGAGGSGAAGLTKAIAICVCAAGGGAAGVAAGVVPAPQALVSGAAAPQVIGDVEPAAATAGGRRGGTEAVRPHKRAREPRRPRTADGDRDLRSRDAEATPPIESTSPVAVPAPAPPPEPASEPVAEPAPEPAPVSSPESVSSGGAAGEFGP